jgi:hypothetical protein
LLIFLLEGRSLAPGLNLAFFKAKFSPHPTLTGAPRNAPSLKQSKKILPFFLDFVSIKEIKRKN